MNHLKAATALTHLLEGRFKILGFRFGLDPVLGLIPWVGDLIAFVLSMYLVWIAIREKLPSEKITQMMKNIVVDLILGSIPVIGDIGDFFYKSNSLNLKILQNHLQKDIRDAELID